MPPCDQFPDGVFIEDNVVMYKGTALITRPGNNARIGEIIGLDKFISEKIGCPIKYVEAPGTLDGGDVLKVGNKIYVGRGGRTNEEGIKQLA